MSFYSEIEHFVEYIHSIRKLKDYLIFDMKFPSKWLIPKSMSDDGRLVPFETDSSDFRGISFVSDVNEIDTNGAIDKITRVIKINKEKELKERLFKEYVDKLKNTFESNNIDKLKNLQFEFNEIDINLNTDESDNEPEVNKLVRPREEEGRNGGEELQEQIDKRNKRFKKGGVVSET